MIGYTNRFVAECLLYTNSSPLQATNSASPVFRHNTPSEAYQIDTKSLIPRADIEEQKLFQQVLEAQKAFSNPTAEVPQFQVSNC